MFFIYGDESIPNHAKDYSIVFPIQHVANGLTINFKPKPEPAHSSHWIELVHPDWFAKSKENHRNGKVPAWPCPAHTRLTSTKRFTNLKVNLTVD